NVWKDYGSLFGTYFSSSTNPVKIQHDKNGTSYLIGNFYGINSDSSNCILRYHPNTSWVSFGSGFKQIYPNYIQPSFNSLAISNKYLTIGGVFESLQNNQASFCIASYELDNPSVSTLSVNLGADTSVYYGYTIFANINGIYN